LDNLDLVVLEREQEQTLSIDVAIGPLAHDVECHPTFVAVGH
jgi:hypothetical protein